MSIHFEPTGLPPPPHISEPLGMGSWSYQDKKDRVLRSSVWGYGFGTQDRSPGGWANAEAKDALAGWDGKFTTPMLVTYKTNAWKYYNFCDKPQYNEWTACGAD